MPQCPRCNKEVYFAERRTSMGKDWHRECLKCDRCSKTLSPGSHSEHEGRPYCNVPCYQALFGPQGGMYPMQHQYPPQIAQVGNRDANTEGLQQVPLPQAAYAPPNFQSSQQYPLNSMNTQFANMSVRKEIPGGNPPSRPEMPVAPHRNAEGPAPVAPSVPFRPPMPMGQSRGSLGPAGQPPTMGFPKAPQFNTAASYQPSSSVPSQPNQGQSVSHPRPQMPPGNPGAPKFPQQPQFSNGPSFPSGTHQPFAPQQRPTFSSTNGMPLQNHSQPQPSNAGPFANGPTTQSTPSFPSFPQYQSPQNANPQNTFQQHPMSVPGQSVQPLAPTAASAPLQGYTQNSQRNFPPGNPGQQFPQPSYNPPSMSTNQGITGAPPSFTGQPSSGGMYPPTNQPYQGPLSGGGPSVDGSGQMPMTNGSTYTNQQGYAGNTSSVAGSLPMTGMPHAPNQAGLPGSAFSGSMPSMPGVAFPPPNQQMGYPGSAFPGIRNPMSSMPPPLGQAGYGGAPPGGLIPGVPPLFGQTMPPQSNNAYMDPSNKKSSTPGLTNDILPSVIDVLEKDMANHNTGYFESRLQAALPPLVTTKCRSIDCGNTIPQLIRSSLFVAPCTANLLKDSGVPFALHIQPMAELPPDAAPIPIVNHGTTGPVRCNRCKAYMSPYMKFVDGGRKFQCPFCLISTDVPQEYFAYLDSEGRRVDMMQRPELCLGTYEFLATTDYCKHNKLPEPPAFIFMIDVSYRAVSSGFVSLVCQMLRNELESLLPVEANGEESKLRVGIATFSDSVHFFNLKSKLSKPSMMTVNDFSDMFVPVVDGFLVRLEESGEMLDTLLDYIPKIFAGSRETDTILLPVIQSGMRALEAAGCPGKLFVFNFSLPVFDAPGKLKNREDRSVLGTDKEKTLLKPQIPDYTKLGEDCVAVGCCVDLFLFPNAYMDVATIGEVSKLTGGQVYKYNFFQSEKDGARFLWDLRHDLKRSIAFDAVMRVRTNTGVRPTDYFGNMFLPNTSEVYLAAIDSEKAVLAEIKHDDKLEDKSIVHIQVALLYTSLSAQRRIRVMNLALTASNEFGELYRCAEIDVIMNFMIKNSLKGLFEFSPAAIREGLAERTTKMLVAYRKNCSAHTPAGQLVLPESLKLLPVYTNCLARSDIVSGTGSEVGADDRSWLILHANSLPVENSTGFLYPRLYALNEMDASNPEYFRQIRATSENMQNTGAYLLENGISMFLWVGNQLDSNWVQDVFGVANVAQIDIEQGDLALSTGSSLGADRIRKFIEIVRASRPLHMRLTIVRQGDKLEPWFRRFLVEDKGQNTFQQSYVEYIYYLYNSIRDELDK